MLMYNLRDMPTFKKLFSKGSGRHTVKGIFGWGWGDGDVCPPLSVELKCSLPKPEHWWTSSPVCLELWV